MIALTIDIFQKRSLQPCLKEERVLACRSSTGKLFHGTEPLWVKLFLT